jgi:uncharacterized protein (TIGR03066 family)
MGLLVLGVVVGGIASATRRAAAVPVAARKVEAQRVTLQPPAAKAVAVDRDMLIGVWQAKKGVPNGQLPGRWEFTREGKVHVRTQVTFKGAMQEGQMNGMFQFTAAGTYEIEGNNLKITFPKAGAEKKDAVVALTITRLTDSELELKNQKGENQHFEKRAVNAGSLSQQNVSRRQGKAGRWPAEQMVAAPASAGRVAGGQRAAARRREPVTSRDSSVFPTGRICDQQQLSAPTSLQR